MKSIKSARKYNNLGLILLSQGKYRQAVTNFRLAMTKEPNLAHVYTNMGHAYLGLNQTQKALECYHQAVNRNHRHPHVFHNIGRLYLSQGNFKKARLYLLKSLRLDPNLSSSHYNLADIYHQTKKAHLALKHLDKTLSLSPNSPVAYNKLGIIHQSLGNLDKSLASFQTAAKLQKKPEYFNNIANIYKLLGNLEKSTQNYKHALKLDPNYSVTHFNLSIVLHMRGLPKQALSHIKAAHKLGLQVPQLFFQHSEILEQLGNRIGAISLLEAAVKIHPRSKLLISCLTGHYQFYCSWKNFIKYRKLLDQLKKIPDDAKNLNVELALNNIRQSQDRQNNLNTSAVWSNMKRTGPQFAHTQPKKSTPLKHIAYISSDFHNHPVAHLVARLFHHHNPKYKVTLFSTKKSDNSYYSKLIKSSPTTFVDITNTNHKQAASIINNHQTSILVDLNGLTQNNRLEVLSLRPAPLNVHFLGYPGSTGADYIDYIIADQIVAPLESRKFFSEKIVNMPHSYQVNDYLQPISSKKYKPEDFGLPAKAFIFSSFNQSFKLDPLTFSTWIKILKTVPNSILWLLQPEENARQNLLKYASANQVKPSRIFFAGNLPKSLHLARIKLVDLCLDTKIYNGHTTTSDALLAGVPVITLLGSHFASRVSASLLTALGTPELITSSLSQYKQLAIDLAINPNKLKALKSKISLQRSKSPLFDTPRFAKNLETAYEIMWARYTQGKLPKSFSVS